MDLTHGLPPIVGENVAVLILGSLPSQRSVEAQQYYAHPTNAFWRIMGALFDAGREHLYTDRLDILTANGIALWDSLAASVRRGSMDSAIDHRTAQPNDFATFFSAHSSIRLIAFNGRESQKSFLRYVAVDPEVPLQGIEQMLMPSTSAANAAMTVEEKIRAWSAMKTYLPTT